MEFPRGPLFSVLAMLLGVAPAAYAAGAATATPVEKSAALFAMKCAKCHTIGGGRRVGPDLRGVAIRRSKDWIVGFVQDPDTYLDKDPIAHGLLEEFQGVRMENLHLTRAEALGIADFLEAALQTPSHPSAEGRVKAVPPLAAKLIMPDEGMAYWKPGLIGAAGLFIGAVLCARFGAPAPALVLAAAAAGLGYWSAGGARHVRPLGTQQGYEPVQPIAYSHALHAGKLQISCFYCHYGAEKSDQAGVPPLSVCMNCHNSVRSAVDSKTPSPEIAKLVAIWESRAKPDARSLEWTRVHRLPDYVHFTHRTHIANNIQCQECHGPVQEMERMRQAAPLTMGWCIECHRRTPASAPTHWKRVGATLDCAACHW